MAQAVCCFYPLVFRYLTTPMAFPQHFKKPPIFPSEEVNRIRSCWNPRLPFSCCTSPLLGAGGYHQLSWFLPQSALWPGYLAMLLPGTCAAFSWKGDRSEDGEQPLIHERMAYHLWWAEFWIRVPTYGHGPDAVCDLGESPDSTNLSEYHEPIQ